ncbi:cytochrome P450 [Stachybotrys elegans]|uniref:Cytochrome P450 n=1 Tax=Stachybotrys elegans TaxID=80388 RepID=A0A8K0SN80_9HYPO|nr:cytochrome P450 [Stachybotrys elegans]
MDNVSSMAMLPSMNELSFSYDALAGNRVAYYVGAAALIITAWSLQSKKKAPHIEVPFYKASKLKWIFDAETLIKHSYDKFKDAIYQIKATEGVQVLVPPKYIGEMKSLPEDVLSATEAVADALQSKYTKFSAGHNGELLTLMLRGRLTQNLARLQPQLKEELDYITTTEFPACDDWTPVKWIPFAVRAVSRLSGRAFVGPSICRDEKWMDTSTNFAVHVFMACVKLQFFPEWARPFAQYLVSDLSKIRRDFAQARELLQPILEQRYSFAKDKSSNTGEAPDDMVQWLIEALPEEEKGDLQTQAELQLIVAAAAIHTTNNLLFECMCDLAANQDIQEELRQEAYQILVVEGGWSKKESIPKLKKLDSFMREVHRLRGSITSFIRKVMKPISLSDGTHLPAGTKVLAPLAGISMDERFFDNAAQFDPWRFYNLRQQSDADNHRWQFTSLSDTSIQFGAGRHACPGRFLAGHMIKLILAQFILNYDIRLKPGQKRPEPMAMVMTKAPSPTTEFEFKRRSCDI